MALKNSRTDEALTPQEKIHLSCGFYNLIEEEGPKSNVGIRTHLPQMGRTAAVCRRSLSSDAQKNIDDLAFSDVSFRGVLLPPFRLTELDSRTIYSGEWRVNHQLSQQSKPHGRGELYFSNEDFYEGSFDQGIPFGIGRLIKKDGSYYQGDILRGKAHGFGISYDAGSETLYRGQFVNGKPSGRGTETTGSQQSPIAKFEGEFSDGYKSYGRYTWGKNREFVYQGRFSRGLFDGKGIITSPAGQFEGNFKDGYKQGPGRMLWLSEKKTHCTRQYNGNYSKDVKSGYGKYIYYGGAPRYYDGWWLADYPNGQGKGIYQGMIFQGNWENGRPVVPVSFTQ